ncbi:hypothetical protein G5C60_06295 [Streptomyces sp. HC44]|uniref:Secreted protein n=1 Tax=Streptomyces scabichelini TaxID=2711217 RepID=A0A6G4UZQ4_9ACTN|nr:hypothetical protein [Streptomyces scabichelini]NGO07268.1 hypothetical protein [Streptomyces scabichelini]
MRKLPARRIATSALCAALLVGITGPAAMAADSTREHSQAPAPDARLRGADALLAQVRAYNRGELTPVADLVHAVLEADNGQLPEAKARKLGAAAKAALAPMAAERRPADLVDDALDALDSLLDALFSEDSELTSESEDEDEDSEVTSESEDSEVPESAEDLLIEVEDLIDESSDSDLEESDLEDSELEDSDLSDSPTVSSKQTQTIIVTRPESGVRLPLISTLASLLLPAK